MDRITPSSLMYADLKRFGRVSNRDAAQILLSDKPMYSGLSPRDRIDERTFLSREVVHAEPGEAFDSMFADLPTAAQTIAARIASKIDSAHPWDEIVEHYSGEASQTMQESVSEWGADNRLYANTVTHIMQLDLPSTPDRAALLVLLFVSCGCLGDPRRASQLTEQFATQILGNPFSTLVSEVGDGPTENPEATDARLGLARIVDGKMYPQIHALEPTEEGTVIGALATTKNAITDVGDAVSKRHLRIWKQDGRWFAEGLESTNGTTLVSGADKSEQVIEPPRAKRSNFTSAPVEIFPSDILVLAKTTSFMVLDIAP